MHNARVHFYCLLVYCITATGACSAKLSVDDALIKELKGRGPVVLSSQNPYLAANHFLSRQVTTSPQLKGFVEYQGIPLAVAIEEPFFGPLSILLYYPSGHYRLTEMNDGWLIKGPVSTSLEEQSTLSSVASNSGTPKIIGLDQASAPPEQSKEEEPATPPLPVLPPERKMPSSAPHQKTLPDKISALIAESKAPLAETTPKGDIVHYVTYAGENLSIISRWYTGEVSNRPRLTRINQIGNPNELRIGDAIVIPGYLVKNRKVLTREALSALEKLVLQQGGSE